MGYSFDARRQLGARCARVDAPVPVYASKRVTLHATRTSARPPSANVSGLTEKVSKYCV
jgi:hypothetical protein